MTDHSASVVHLNTGWIRWSAVCTCGWRSTAPGGREGAEDAALQHNLDHAQDDPPPRSCTCWDHTTMEFDPAGPCTYCQTIERDESA